MINIVLPIAGLAQRFVDKGYELPKPLIEVDGIPMIKLAVQSLLKGYSDDDVRLIFVVRDAHINSHRIDDALSATFADYEVIIVVTNGLTRGTLCSCLLAAPLVDNDEPLIIYTPDVCYDDPSSTMGIVQNVLVDQKLDGLLLTFQANSKDHSYAVIENGQVTKTAEKVVISNDALAGVYCFRTGKSFVKYANQMIEREITVNNEFYISPMFNLLIADGLKVVTSRIQKMYVLGTPADLEFYNKTVSRFKNGVQFAVCADHSGFNMKLKIVEVLGELGFQYTDFGPENNQSSDHYDTLLPCIKYIMANDNCFGIATCTTGQGFNIAANKVVGIRSAIIHDVYTAEMARRHNAANFFCIPCTVEPRDLQNIISALLHTFDGGRHATRITKIENDPLFIK